MNNVVDFCTAYVATKRGHRAKAKARATMIALTKKNSLAAKYVHAKHNSTAHAVQGGKNERI